jgi:hypothetical protein
VRDKRGAVDLTLHGVPPGRKPAGPAVADAVAGVLSRLNVEDVKERAPGALQHQSQARFRTFEGFQLDLDGYRERTAARSRRRRSRRSRPVQSHRSDAHAIGTCRIPRDCLVRRVGCRVAARSNPEPPPDILKAQRESLEKAKATEKVLQDAAERRDAQMGSQQK